MKKKNKGKLIILLAAAASTLLLGGCTIGQSLEEILIGKNLTAQVTYYSNGGEFDGTPDKKEMYYTAGSLAMEIGNPDIRVSSGTASISRAKYQLTGWYYAVDGDKDGVPDYEDDSETDYKLGEPVDFTKPLQEGDHWVLVAGWQPDVNLKVVMYCPDLAAGEKISVKLSDGTEVAYGNGDVIDTRIFDKDTGRLTKKEVPFTVKGRAFTFIEYYANTADTTPLQWPIQRQEGQETDTVVYAKFMRGDWVVVSDAADVETMMKGLPAQRSYWLLNDVQMDGREVKLDKSQTMMNATIQGNGYTIKGLKIRRDYLTQGSYSLFGDIRGTAVIEDISFEDLQVTYKLQNATALSLYGVFSSLDANATVSNVNISGGSWTIEKESSWVIQNIVNDSDFSHCLFGGDEYTTDSEYSDSVTDGFKVNDGAAPSTFITIKTL